MDTIIKFKSVIKQSEMKPRVKERVKRAKLATNYKTTEYMSGVVKEQLFFIIIKKKKVIERKKKKKWLGQSRTEVQPENNPLISLITRKTKLEISFYN